MQKAYISNIFLLNLAENCVCVCVSLLDAGTTINKLIVVIQFTIVFLVIRRIYHIIGTFDMRLLIVIYTSDTHKDNKIN